MFVLKYAYILREDKLEYHSYLLSNYLYIEVFFNHHVLQGFLTKSLRIYW